MCKKRIFYILLALYLAIISSLYSQTEVNSVKPDDKASTDSLIKDDDTKDTDYINGLAALKDLRYEESASLLKSAMDKDPENTNIPIHLSEALSALKKTDEAIKLLEALILKQPDAGRAYRKLGRIYSQNGDYAKACENFARACELEPDFAWNFNNAGYTLIMLGRSEEAVEKLNRAIELDQSEAIFHKNLESAKSRIRQ